MATAKLKIVPEKPLTTGGIIDKLWQLREDKKEVAKQELALNSKIAELETQLYERMDKEESTKGAGNKASVSLGTQNVIQFAPGDESRAMFAAYVLKSKQTHLYEHRISQLAAQELYRLKGGIPGTVVFTKRKINLTTTN
jgi:hypothetical protein